MDIVIGENAARPDNLSPSGRVRFLRDPIMLFTLVGALIFGIYHFATRGDPVIYTEAVNKALIDDHEAVLGRPATDEEKARLRNDYIEDELLFREAIAQGDHLTDSIVRKRLVDKMRYAAAGQAPDPTDAEMVNFYADHIETYRTEPKMSFEHVFFSAKPDQTRLSELQKGGSIEGDDFWVGRNFPHYGESMIRGIFGQPFLEQLKAAPEGEWSGLYRSSRGWHFVRKSETIAPELRPFSEVQDQVRLDMTNAFTKAGLEAEMIRLTQKYGVEDAD